MSLVGCDFAVKEIANKLSEVSAGHFVAVSAFNDSIGVLFGKLHSLKDLFAGPRSEERFRG